MQSNDEHRASALDALSRVLESSHLRQSPALQKILGYIVTEELEGRGENIKAYSIALDALDKPDSFDPQLDPAVRVNFTRLRNALSLYYSDEGKNDPVQIEVKKGSYRPTFPKNPEIPEEAEQKLTWAGSLLPRFNTLHMDMLIVAVCFAGLVSGYLFFRLSSAEVQEDRKTQSPSAEIPIVEVYPFSNLTSGHDRYFIEGLRLQLIVDLSHFNTLRVRAIPSKPESEFINTSNLRKADYRLDGKTYQTENNRQLALVFSEKVSGNIIWSSNVNSPSNDAQFQKVMFESVRSIVNQLADVSGVIQTESLRRLAKRRDKLGDESTTSYECVLLFHTFDLTKNKSMENAARQCLSRLTGEGSLDSTVWAAWSFLRFLDWTKEPDQQVLDEALNAVRTAIRLDPSDATGHEYLGSILMAIGRRDKALESYIRAIELNPSKPDLHVLLGWHSTLDDNWEKGIAKIKEGISLSYAPPGWMKIPLSINAFRLDNYEKALSEAEAIIQTGDKRGVVLALAAALALEKSAAIEKYLTMFMKMENASLSNPMKEIRSVFNHPAILEKYEETISAANLF